MQYKCDVCHDSGSKNQTGDYLDCPACDMPHTRKALNDFVKSLGPTHPEDVALAIHQRALAMGMSASVEDTLNEMQPGGALHMPQEPVAHLKFWAAQSWSGNGNHDIDCGEGLEVCEPGEIGADGKPAFPVFMHAIPGALAMAPKQEAPAKAAWEVKLMADYAPRAIAGVSPEPFILGNQYRTQGGRLVRFVSIANEGNSYETMADELGHHRYTRRDFGRGTGAAWDDDCVPPLYTAPAPIAAPAAANGALTDEQIGQMWKDLGGDNYPAATRFARAILAAAGPDAALTELHVSSIARYLSDFTSSQCNVDKDDAWKIYGDDEIERVRAALTHAGVALSGAKGN